MFEAVKGTSNKGDIAIDDVTFLNGRPCSSSDHATTHVYSTVFPTPRVCVLPAANAPLVHSLASQHA
ncbi:hypothetical protein PoB_001174700 [Plakobranchus ocellatus]|uniref:MAM domain-containing protein n=1 Tax=Plakobranchus ocellatus TaxID=259542 RepID=A0AAV3YRX7_9GAST|nr:hypothetical protein PoB_001174700 [Plakobranchus ocellatus]